MSEENQTCKPTGFSRGYLTPREIAGMLNNGNKLRVMMNGEKWLFNGIELTYEEVI